MASVSFSGIESTIGANITSQETKLNNALASIGSDPSTADLLALQSATQRWGMMSDIQATIIKSLADSMKSIIQKAG